MPSRRKFQELEVLLTMRDRTRKVLQGTIRTIARLRKASFDAAKVVSGIGAVSGAGFGLAARAAGRYALEVGTIASQLDLTTDRFQELLAVAQLRRPATDAQSLGQALKDVVERLTEANELREGGLFDRASAIGLNTELTKSNEIIEDFIQNMRNVSAEQGLQRIRELGADDAFEELFELVSLTNEEFAEMADTARSLGLIIRPETLENLAAMERSLGVVQKIISTMAVELAGQLAPGIENAALAFAAFVQVNGGALPVLEKVWQRVTERVNQFIISYNKLASIVGLDIPLLGDENQQSLAHATAEIADIDAAIAKIREQSDFAFFPQRRIANLEKLRTEYEAIRDAAIGISVPDTSFNFDGMEEAIDKLKRQLDSNLSELGTATNRAATSTASPSSEQVSELARHWLLTGRRLGEAAQTGMEAGLAGLGDLIDFELPDIDAQICEDAKMVGERTADCLGDGFAERMQNIQTISNAASQVLSGLDSLMQANEQREIDRLNRMRSRNAAELDILKTRLSDQQSLNRNEVALHNARAAAIAGNNAKIDQLAARAELQACKRAKKFAILQGALSVASAWAGASQALAGPFPANLAAFATVLSTGLSAAAQVSKFNCNSIGSTSGGGVGGVGGGSLGGTGGNFQPTTRQGADLPSDLFGRRNQMQQVINITLEADVDIDAFTARLNDSDAQINVERVAGVF